MKKKPQTINCFEWLESTHIVDYHMIYEPVRFLLFYNILPLITIILYGNYTISR